MKNVFKIWHIRHYYTFLIWFRSSTRPGKLFIIERGYIVFFLVKTWFESMHLRNPYSWWRHMTTYTQVRWWLVAWRHEVITWTNVDFSQVRSGDILPKKTSENVIKPSFTEIILRFTYPTFDSNLPGANELNNGYGLILEIWLMKPMQYKYTFAVSWHGAWIQQIATNDKLGI